MPEGEYRGTFILPLDAVPQRGIAASAGRMAWHGKVFDAGARRVTNRVLPFGVRAVTAEVCSGPSRLDGRECIVLDYSRTSLIAHSVRDELWLLRPGLYLGRAYWHGLRVADFALEACLACRASPHTAATTVSSCDPANGGRHAAAHHAPCSVAVSWSRGLPPRRPGR